MSAQGERTESSPERPSKVDVRSDIQPSWMEGSFAWRKASL